MMTSAAGNAFTFVLAFALLYYCRVLFLHWYRKGYDSIALNTVPVLPKFASDDKNLMPVAGVATQKGVAFEGFVAGRFSKEYFNLIHWRSDKYVNGIYALSNSDPDLEMEYRGGGQVVPFAVECKWRSQYNHGSIEWAKNYQIKNYKEYQRRKYMYVYVVIGMGGTENEPAEMYIIPLNEIGKDQTILSREFMRPFRRDTPRHAFFLDTREMSLK